MNKEFKKIKSKLETRYILESASAGATSAGAVATGPVGKKGNLLVQDKDGKPEVQRRNPVAANVNAAVGGGGAGAHVDRKKKDKNIRGQKHKKDWRRDVDESGLQYYTGKKKYGKDGMAALAKAGRDGASEEELGRIKDKYKKNEGYGMGGYATYAGTRHGRGVAELDSHYIDQENDMTASDLKSLYKQAVKLRDLIQKMGDDATLEPWQQTKIAKAADYVNAVFKNLDNEYSLGEEKQKGLDGNACWKGYKRMGTKMKGGKRVDNCVPIKEEAEVNVPGFGVVPLEMLKKHVKELSKDFNEYIQNDDFLKAAYRSEQFYNALMALAKAIKNLDKDQPVSEKMMPASHFAGTPKNKLGPTAHLKGKMKRPARQGDLVGGSAEESYSKKKTLKKN